MIGLTGPDDVERFWATVATKLGLLGITRVANVTGLDHVGVPVVMAVRPLSRSLTVAQGKGLTLTAAKVSAVMEAAESFHAERVSMPVWLGSERDFEPARARVDLSRLCRARQGRVDFAEPLVWVQADSHATGGPVLVPIECVHTAFTPAMDHYLGRFFNSTAGLAGGATDADATLHGLYEVIERDAALLTSLEPQSEQDRRRLDVSTVTAPECITLLNRLQTCGIQVGLWELTQDTGVPVYRCVLVNADTRDGRRVCSAAGLGCHARRAMALQRAILEAIQTRLTVIAGSRDDLFRDHYSENLTPATRAAHRTLVDGNGTRPMGEDALGVMLNAKTQLITLVERLRCIGLDEVLVVRLGMPDIGIAVVRVIVPGLEIYDSLEDCIPGDRARRVMAMS